MHAHPPARRSLYAVAPALGAALLALAVAPQAAQADIIVQLGGSDQAVQDTSYDYLNDDNFLPLGFVGVGVETIKGLRVGLEYQGQTIDSEPFLGVETRLDLDGVFATSRLEASYRDFVTPYIAFGVGAYYVDLLMNIEGEQREQAAWAPGGFATGGVELRIPRRWVHRGLGIDPEGFGKNFTAGLSLELGYNYIGAVEFDALERPEPDKEPEPEDAPLAGQTTRLGELGLDGLMMRFAFQLHF